MEWIEFKEREDLHMIPELEAAGYKAVFNGQDILYKRMSPDEPPLYAVEFRKGNKRIWKIREGWQTCDLIDGYFVNHKSITHLKELLQ